MCGRSLDGLIEKLPQVRFCCCGCRLFTGSKIIGWLNCVYGVIIEILWVCLVVGMILLSRQNPEIPDDEKTATLIGIVFVGLIGGLLFGLVIALAVVLLVGIYKNDVKKVRCWLQINLVLFIIALVFASLTFIATLFFKPIDAIGQLITIAINFGITFYVITVVKSFYTEQVAAFQRVSTEQA